MHYLAQSRYFVMICPPYIPKISCESERSPATLSNNSFYHAELHSNHIVATVLATRSESSENPTDDCFYEVVEDGHRTPFTKSCSSSSAMYFDVAEQSRQAVLQP